MKPKTIAEYHKAFDELFKNHVPQELNTNCHKIKGWVARETDGDLWLFSEKPSRRNDGLGGEAWFGFGFFPLENLYPELSCKDDPIEVELTIKKI